MPKHAFKTSPGIDAPIRTGHKPGFTLIEMALVMALIGLLLTLAVPRYFSTLDHGKAKVQQQNLASLRDAIDKFFGDQGRYPETLDDLVQKRYLRSVPIDPITERADWVSIAPNDPQLGAIYDVRSAARTTNDTAQAQ
jgi:general secretion pathway protein G